MLISNINENHRDQLFKIFYECRDRIVIASPYLADDIKSLLNQFKFFNISKVDLVTTFKNRDIDQITKPFQLRDFFVHFAELYPGVELKIHIDNQLHGKMYFAVDDDIKRMILTSGNFTQNGLSNNHEWGVLIEDQEIIAQALEELYQCIEYPEVSFNQISKACMFAEQYLNQHPEWREKPDIFPDILNNVYSDSDDENVEPQFFLKPIGHSDSPIELKDREDFSGLHQNLHFSKKYPKGVRKGDFIITTAVGAGSLLSYFRVVGGLQHVSNAEIEKNKWAERWPWYVEGKNNSPTFGANWWIHNIRRQDLLEKFKDLFKGEPVTYAGGYGLGTINRGNDRVRLTKKFGEFLISEIKKCEIK